MTTMSVAMARFIGLQESILGVNREGIPDEVS